MLTNVGFPMFSFSKLQFYTRDLARLDDLRCCYYTYYNIAYYTLQLYMVLHHLYHKLLLTSTTTKMTSCHPNHGLQDLISEPEVRPVVLDHLQHHLVLPGTTMMISCPSNLGLQDLIREPEVRPVVTHHLQHHLVLTGMTTMMILCPPNLGLQDRIREPEIRPSLQTLVQHHPMRTRMTM